MRIFQVYEPLAVLFQVVDDDDARCRIDDHVVVQVQTVARHASGQAKHELRFDVRGDR